MRINTIHLGCEGEGYEVGIPKVFIRTQGCQMGCISCDTPEAKNPNGGRKMSVEQVIEKVKKYNLKHVTITGGNPLEQNLDELYDLIFKLKRLKYKVSLEATGSDEATRRAQLHRIYNEVDFLSFDMKSPSAKCNFPFHKSSVGWSHKAQYKIVIADWKDYNFAKEMIKKYRMCKIVLTPCWNVNDKLNKKFVQKLFQKVLKEGLKCRVIVQQHKVLFGPNKRDV